MLKLIIKSAEGSFKIKLPYWLISPAIIRAILKRAAKKMSRRITFNKNATPQEKLNALHKAGIISNDGASARDKRRAEKLKLALNISSASLEENCLEQDGDTLQKDIAREQTAARDENAYAQKKFIERKDLDKKTAETNSGEAVRLDKIFTKELVKTIKRELKKVRGTEILRAESKDTLISIIA